MLKFFNILNFILILSECNALHKKGRWASNDNFFYFLTRFGFQKTNQHDIENSEGYIFGNITSYHSKNSSSKASGTLVLLPHQYFIPFYKNQTLIDTEGGDKACEAMFKNIEVIAYDARCHDTGKEDFLRKIPCPKGELCADEDNPANVIPENQLTYAVQDINNPRFWYLSFVACRRNETCGWEYVDERIVVEYDLFIVNGKPSTTRTNIFEYHFSFEEQDTVEVYLFCLLLYSCFLVPLQVYAAYIQIHPITRLFTCILLTHLTGLGLDSLHLLVFSFNGIGIRNLSKFGEWFNMCAESFFIILLLLIAKGWAVTRNSLKGEHFAASIWLAYSVLRIIFYSWNEAEMDVIEDIDEFQTLPGWLTLVLRVAIMLVFLFELKTTMKHEHNAAKLQFFLQFGAATLVWFIYMPVVALIALQVSPLWRYKIILGFKYCADFLAHSFMAYMLWPKRSEQYLLLADEVDLADELEAFDEAPQALHPQDYFNNVHSEEEQEVHFTNHLNIKL